MAGADNKARRRRSLRKVTKTHFLISKNAKYERKEKLKKISEILKKPEKLRTTADKVFVSKNPEIVKTSEKNARQLKAKKERMLEIEDEPGLFNLKCVQLAELIKSSKYIVVYTGAGISTAASIPDYRGPNGVWTLLKKGQDMCPQDLSDAEPTLTHMSLTGLYKYGKVKHVVSQNCDGLHLRSGFPRSALSEVHGNMYIECCYSCVPHKEYIRLFDVTERTSMHRHATARACHVCGGNLKDTIVHFGEKGKLTSPYRWKEAIRAAKKTDLIICLGSSLKVLKKYSALWSMDKKPMYRPKLVIVNLQWTPKDDVATLKINGKCDNVMSKVMEILSYKIPVYIREQDPIFIHHTPLLVTELQTTSKKILSVPLQLRKIKQPRKNARLKMRKIEKQNLEDKLNNVDISLKKIEQLTTSFQNKNVHISNATKTYPVIRNLLRNSTTVPNSGCYVGTSLKNSSCTHFCCNNHLPLTDPTNKLPHGHRNLQLEEFDDIFCIERKAQSQQSNSEMHYLNNEVNFHHEFSMTHLPEVVVIDLEKSSVQSTRDINEQQFKMIPNAENLNPYGALSHENEIFSCEKSNVDHSCKESIDSCMLFNCVGSESLLPKLTPILQMPIEQLTMYLVSNEIQTNADAHLTIFSDNFLNFCDSTLFQDSNISDAFVSNYDVKERVSLDHSYCQKQFNDVKKQTHQHTFDEQVMLRKPLILDNCFSIQSELLNKVRHDPAKTNCMQSEESKILSKEHENIPESTAKHCDILNQAHIKFSSTLCDKATSLRDSFHIITKGSGDCFYQNSSNLECSQFRPALCGDTCRRGQLKHSLFQKESNDIVESQHLTNVKTNCLSPSIGVAEETNGSTSNKRKLSFSSLPGWYGKGLGIKRKRR
ncbi:NAD-dependent protein deacetylase sir-2.1 [Biomphalaria pfeifferi]|uniref:protein acetyllysine N-acetyltransferase n=1 Tax=Biomphalaria pfeifferi TaxID=112525 RepID=A0AAD8FAG6_BIOPF|nr:NAD-dependent protein deacetylase sir-2.1 [Biomphalaria pfeifferi]